ncbi:hypothetical protein EDD52_11290 [Primorskyibacter sedentarius]|uniref:Uncharacterized protein n=1 Tax=Primorskyibacter sedentarius TaxID=745311 RepID=A0A4R3J6X2_9RHOB|nr:hypothetical protein EDD52_11290 [Primorskyibacter sedentarius]
MRKEPEGSFQYSSLPVGLADFVIAQTVRDLKVTVNYKNTRFEGGLDELTLD